MVHTLHAVTPEEADAHLLVAQRIRTLPEWYLNFKWAQTIVSSICSAADAGNAVAKAVAPTLKVDRDWNVTHEQPITIEYFLRRFPIEGIA